MASLQPKVLSFDQYDSHKAKWFASVQWLLAKAGGGVFPPEYGEPLCIDDYDEVCVSKVTLSGLTSGDLYRRVCNAIFRESLDKHQGHIGVIQILTRFGFYVCDDCDDLDALENQLMQMDPLHEAAHIALIDALMSAYCALVARVDKVVQAVRKFSTFSGSSELPTNVEDALLFWLNKSCVALTRRLHVGSPSKMLKELRDVGDGRCLVSAISFYRPNELPAETIASSCDVADCVFNLNLVAAFCQRHLPMTIFVFSVDDLFYCIDEMRTNIAAFIADLFHCLEQLGIDSVMRESRPTMSSTPLTAGTQVRPPLKVPAVSQTTKRSFHYASPPSNTPVQQDIRLGSATNSVSGHHQPLLPRRHVQGSAQFGVSEDGYRPVEAWPSRPHTRNGNESERSNSSDLLSNVDIDASLDFVGTSRTDMSLDDSEDFMSARIDLNVAGSYQQPALGPLTSSRSIAPAPSGTALGPSASYTVAAAPVPAVIERLQPARLRPVKEKNNADTKKLESGEQGGKLGIVKRSPDDAESDSTTPSEGYRTPMHDNSPPRDAGSASSGSAVGERFVYETASEDNFDPTRSYVICSPTLGNLNTAALSGSVSGRRGPGSDGSDDTELTKLRTDAASKEQFGNEAGDLTVGGDTENELTMRTSFAKLRKFKDRNSGSFESPVIYDQQGNASSSKMVKSVVVAPSHMTWMEAARIQRSASEREVGQMPPGNVNGNTAPAQLAGLRMKLEEKRRNIESGKRQAELQRTQLNQQAGQQAFVQVIRKKDKPANTQIDEADTRSVPSSTGSVGPGDMPMTNGEQGVQRRLNKDATFVKERKVIADKTRMEANVRQHGNIAQANPQREVNKTMLSRISSADETKRYQPADTVRRPYQTEQDVANSNVMRSRGAPAQSQMTGSWQVIANKTGNLEPPQGLSFDRLSTSLSDLQAEIARLTQQQDEIKNLVSGGGNTTSSVDHSPFYLYPSTDRTDRCPTPQSAPVMPAPPAQAYPVPVQPNFGSQPPVHGYPIDAHYYAAGYGPYAQPYIPTSHASSVPPGGMYMSPMPPQMHRYPIGSPYMPPYPQDPGNVYRTPQPPGMLNSSPPFHRPQHAASGNAFYQSQAPPAQITIPDTAYRPPIQPSMGETFMGQQWPPHTTSSYYMSAPYSDQQVPSPLPMSGQYTGVPMPQVTETIHSEAGLQPQSLRLDNTDVPPTAVSAPPVQIRPENSNIPNDADGQPVPSEEMCSVTGPALPAEAPEEGESGSDLTSHMDDKLMVPGDVQSQSSEVECCESVGPTEVTLSSSEPAVGVTAISSGISAKQDCSAPILNVPTSQPTAFFIDTSESITTEVPVGQSNDKAAVRKVKSEMSRRKSSHRSPPVAFTVTDSMSESVVNSSASAVVTSSAPRPSPSAFYVDASPVSVSPSDSGSDCNILLKPPAPVSLADRGTKSTPNVGETSPDITKPTSSSDSSLPVNSSDSAASMSPVLLVFGQTSVDMSELEKRKQKFQEQQMKRREEQEQRRLALEEEQNKKREALKSKQEEEERRRAEDKARREAIYENYLKRRMAAEGSTNADPPPPSAGNSSTRPAGAANVVLRKKSNMARATPSRPLSMPPPLNSASNLTPVSVPSGPLTAHASDDSLLETATVSSLSSSDRLSSTPDVRDPTSYGHLYYGGLTHRRPPTPERGSHHDGQFAQDYTGPKLFVKPTAKSNRTIIINAISHCCLAGVVNKDKVDKVIEEINRSTAVQFIILFRDAGMQYRGLYTYNPDDAASSEVILTKIHGTGPKQLSSMSMEKFYKYNCGAKNFTEVASTKHLTATIDAVTVLNSVWAKSRPPAVKKPS